MAKARSQPWSVEDFLAFEAEEPERYEFVGGVVRLMTGGSAAHSAIKGNLYAALRSGLAEGPCRAYVNDLKVVTDSAVSNPSRVTVTVTPFKTLTVEIDFPGNAFNTGGIDSFPVRGRLVAIEDGVFSPGDVTSFTVDGVPQSVGADGAFSINVPSAGESYSSTFEVVSSSRLWRPHGHQR